MARLPTPGSDDGKWGQILNDYLSQSHDSSGNLKSDSVGTAQLQDNAVTAAAIADDAITSDHIAPGVITKSAVGLGNVDNTSDTDKPVSAAQQTALDAKADVSALAAKLNTADLDAQTAAKITDGESAINSALAAQISQHVFTPTVQLPEKFSRPHGSIRRVEIPPEDYPKFTKHADPVFTYADVASPEGMASIYWAWLVDNQDGSLSGRAPFIIATSLDHSDNLDAGQGIRFFENSNLLDPEGWEQIGSPIVDLAIGNQFETGSVIEDPYNSGLYRVYCQIKPNASLHAHSGQVTIQYTTTDFLDFTYVGVAIDPPNPEGASNYHGGYLQPTVLPNKDVFGRHLYRGSQSNWGATSTSYDGGNTFKMDPRPLGPSRHLVPNNYTFAPRGVPFQWRGRWWLLGDIRLATSGATVSPGSGWFVAPLTEDLRQFAGPPVACGEEQYAWENDIFGIPVNLIPYNGGLVGMFRSGGPQGAFGVAMLEAE